MRNSLWVLVLVSIVASASAGQRVRINVANSTKREKATKVKLQHMLDSYDLTQYTFTQEVLIKEGAINHALPILTLNVRFAKSGDDLLSSYIHEQIHWHLKEHGNSQRHAVAELRQMYPRAPIGLPDGAETAYSTYGHLVTCYLEIQAIRGLLGGKRAAAVVNRKRHYLWIYRTVLSDEEKIDRVIRKYGLGIK